jgi:hypothetical protein
MTAGLGYQTTLALGGTPTTFTRIKCVTSDSHTYRIDDSARDVWDPETALVVELYSAGWTTAAANSYVIDYASGSLYFASTPTGEVYASGKHIPLLPVAEARSLEMEGPGYGTVDVSVFGSVTPLEVTATRSWKGTIEIVGDLSTDYDGATLEDLLVSERIFLDMRPAGVGSHARGWVRLEPAKRSSKNAEAHISTLTFTGVCQTVANRAEQALFGWSAHR